MDGNQNGISREKELIRRNDYFTIETFFYDDNRDLWEIEVHDEKQS